MLTSTKLLLAGLLASLTYFAWFYKCLHVESQFGFVEYCQYYNYPVQEFDVTTPDGYVIKMFRIQQKNTSIADGKPVVLLVHGFLDLSDTFIINDEDKAPGFILANRGYDVWFGNNRGNSHSRSHTKLDPNTQSEFWDFSFQEMASQDLPSMFAQILKACPGQKINYIGHSQGSLQMFAALSERNPVIVDNLRKFVSLGPAVYLEHTQIFQTFYNMIHLYNLLLFTQKVEEEVMPSYALYTYGARYMCGYFPSICKYIVGSTSTNNYEADNYLRYDIVACKQPAGSSKRNALHYQQLIESKRFQQFDFGPEGNLLKYGQATAPQWNLSNIREEVIMFTATDDSIVRPEDVAKLKSQLTGAKSVKEYHVYGGHLSFMYGKDMSYFDTLLEALE